MKNYFEGFATNCITVPCESDVKEGSPVSLDNTSTAYVCYDGTEFMGVCTQVRDGYATVVITGYAQFSYEGQQPSVGFIKLVCGSEGTVKVDEVIGRTVMVVAVDEQEKKVGVIL